ncbi:hypothetical protein Kpol_457p7 [Vanderwaltozyma polyspora DSM 70294]|uniref:Vacuolar protein sorting-associated protein 28 n=1 Tax=Vanderwaltozyma polyspora (strain ATCC 22028 / DSM 70294 / BCRC 21397 / CBS 2163 / NBRC 10782 / NRRL Y-8283 / UCD 57-17) TaxID=436907 RepID=A7TQU8_VANPO|nr:uncharacterized protein Kpol_457p7 [Vanderwaltozyma polyspora DSM 70294]EDO15356.1 hypothetical protein Kpol_457p7 [Vanderwaltozyma polyspora DSM 70294]
MINMPNYHSTLNEEIVLFENTVSLKEKEAIETLSDIYSIIIAIDQVEKAYLKDSVSNEEYTSTVNKLLIQYRTYLSNDNEDLQRLFGDLNAFKERYNIVAPNAITRLERGIPVTVEHAIESNSPNAESGGSSNIANNAKGKHIAEATGNFITIMDALKLNYKAKDQLHPLMAELLLSVNRVTQSDFENRGKLIEWIVKINKMKVDAVLTDTEARELLFDLDLAYKSFYALLG